MNQREAVYAKQTLEWHEKWREDAAKRWAAARPQKMGESWKPTMTPGEKEQFDRQNLIDGLPF